VVEMRKGNSKLSVELVGAGAVEAATLQGITDASQDYLLLVAADPELSRIWRIANDDPNLLSESDATRYFFLIRVQWLRYQNAYLQWRRGTMSDTDWALYNKFVCDPSGSTRRRAKRLLWSDHRAALLDDFVQFVETCWQVNQLTEE
jgi:hypothetical protein